jgi:TPR repeat protein
VVAIVDSRPGFAGRFFRSARGGIAACGAFRGGTRHALFAAALLAFGAGAVHGQTDLEALQARASRGDAEALNALGTAHSNGQGVTRDYAAALEFYQLAADRGLAAAWFNVGMAHELGRGVPANVANAFKYYLKAAELGFAPAQFNVGNMYANGVGVKPDPLEAVVWFRQAADRGVPEAQFNLGLAYELGRGVRKDEPMAQRWYQLSAGQGNARAQYNLALMLEEGRGSPADPVGAMSLYRAAALQNFAPAQNNLGILLAEGRGGPANLAEAFVWLTLAFENEVTPNDVREIVAQKLSATARDEANVSLAQLRLRLGMKEPAASRGVPSEPAVGQAPPQAVAAAVSPELAALKKRLAAAETDLEKTRAENSRLAEFARAADQNRLQAEQLAARAASAAAENIRPATIPPEVEKLAAGDPRIAQLIAENARLTGEMKQSALEISQLYAQIRILQAGAPPVAAAAPSEASSPAAAAKVAELTRRVEVLLRTVDKLAEESRFYASIRTDLLRLRQENEQLKAERRRNR